eukprot:620341_1
MVQDEFNPKQNNKTSIQIAFTFPINAHNDPLSTFFPNFSHYHVLNSPYTRCTTIQIWNTSHITFQNAKVPKRHLYLSVFTSPIAIWASLSATSHDIPKCPNPKMPSLFGSLSRPHHMTFQNAQIPKCHRYLGLSLGHIT